MAGASATGAQCGATILFGGRREGGRCDALHLEQLVRTQLAQQRLINRSSGPAS